MRYLYCCNKSLRKEISSCVGYLQGPVSDPYITLQVMVKHGGKQVLLKRGMGFTHIVISPFPALSGTLDVYFKQDCIGR